MKQKVITKVLKVSDNTKERMIEYFKFNKRSKTPPYAIFQADEEDTVVTLYESGKVVFQGISADIDANMWNEIEMQLNGKNGMIEKKDKKEVNQDKAIPLRISSIGSDEVGTGDYFGPIVVTATYVSKDNIDFLLDLGVKDSKKLTDIQIIKIVPEIIKKIPYKTFILNNNDYNKYREDNFNMNKMKAILHNKVLYDIKGNGYNYDYIVVDQFENPKSYFNHIKDSSKKVSDIFFLTKAEDQCLSVACASMISRYIFLKEMKRISNELSLELPKGANPLVDEVGKKIVKMYGKEKLNEIAKLNFKNTDRILNN